MTDTTFRLRELHDIFVTEFDRHAHDNAVRLLKQIAEESAGGLGTVTPTATPAGRLEYWHTLYDRARSIKHIDRAAQCLKGMRREHNQRPVAA